MLELYIVDKRLEVNGGWNGGVQHRHTHTHTQRNADGPSVAWLLLSRGGPGGGGREERGRVAG